MTKREIVAALEKYADDAELYILCESIYGVDEDGEETAVHPGICMLDENDGIDYLGEVLLIIPEDEEYSYYGQSGLA